MAPRPDTWMPLYVGDYLADTMHLDTEAHGAYLLLTMSYWRAGAPLPDDDARLAAVVRQPVKRWKALRPVMSEFFTVADGVWRHKRIDAELAKANAIVEARSEAGKRGGRPKANAKQTESKTEANAKQTERPSQSPSPDVVNTTSTATPVAVVDWTDIAEQACVAAKMKPGRAVNEIGTAAEWAKAGYDPALVLKVIRSAAGLPGYAAPNGLRYFSSRIADAHAARKPAVAAVVEWTPALAAWRKDGTWLGSWGPKPGEPGCRVPAELLTKAA